jgi:signal transduction histidine kinase
MNSAAGFAKQLVARQGLLTFAAFVMLSLLAPLVLRLTGEAVLQTGGHVLGAGGAAGVVVALLTHLFSRKHRFTLRALAMGSQAIEPTDLDALRILQRRVVGVQLVTNVLASAALATTWFRPDVLSAEVSRQLATLGATTAFAIAVPAFVLSQRMVGKLLEIAPVDSVTAQLEALEELDVPRKRSRTNILYAVVVPVAIVGVGGVLASYAHLRALTEQGRTATAMALARGVIGSGEANAVGKEAAVKVAKKNGYNITLHDDELDPSVERSADDVTHTIPVARGSASVSFRSNLPLSRTFPLAAVAACFVLLASAAAVFVARLVSSDLAGAADRLRTLGTERVLAGEEASISARFGVVAELEQAALALAGRFRIFAAAQERAIESKEAARRMRGLLFASVSHDLKTPLNAIVGFADALDREALTTAQRESLDLISTRGRELVALIETILDAARVEAGQLALVKKRTSVAGLVYLANQRARELVGVTGELRIEMAEGLPAATVDATHVSRALAVVIAHALRAGSAKAAGSGTNVVLRASVAAGGKQVRIEIDYGEAPIDAAELRVLFSQQQTSRAKGLTLGLSLARSVFEMHGGTIEVTGATGESTVVHALLPV